MSSGVTVRYSTRGPAPPRGPAPRAWPGCTPAAWYAAQSGPNSSYSFRFLGSDSTSCASDSSLNRDSAVLSSLFRSG